MSRQVPFPSKLLLDHHLGGDSGVINSRQVQRNTTVHSVPAGNRVLDSGHQSVPQMQRSGNIWRRNHHNKLPIVAALESLLHVRCIELLGLPPLSPCTFYILGMIGRQHFFQNLLFAPGRVIHQVLRGDLLRLLFLLIRRGFPFAFGSRNTSLSLPSIPFRRLLLRDLYHLRQLLLASFRQFRLLLIAHLHELLHSDLRDIP
mmetsp:Transcript_29874/g.114683  ORF Transcript_29874/g.114683 Transcript_29874/m.114683 type:complete len:202 (-) Transcript_29874:80-685(-)